MSASSTPASIGITAPVTQSSMQEAFPPLVPPSTAPTEPADEKLKDGFRNIFEANRLAGEMKEHERKIENYKTIRDILNNDDCNAPEYIKLERAVAERTYMLKKLKESLNVAEQRAIRCFKAFITRASDAATANGKELQKSLEELLENHASTLSNQQKLDIQLIHKDISALQTEKISKEDRKELLDKVAKVKTELLDTQEKKADHLRLQNRDAFVQLQSRMDGMSHALHTDAIERITTRVMKQVTEEFKLDQFEDIGKSVAELHQSVAEQSLRERQAASEQREKQQLALPEKMTEYIRSQVDSYLNPSRLQTLVSNFPEMMTLKRAAEQIESQTGQALDLGTAPAPSTPDSSHYELEIQALQERLAEQSALLNETRTLLDTFRSRGIRLSQENIDEARVVAAVKQIDELSRKVHLVRNNLSSVETKFDLQVQELQLKLQAEEDSPIVGDASRKRLRTIDTSHESRGSVDGNEGESHNSTTDAGLDAVERRLQAKEDAIQQLIDYIHQFRNTILNPSFPDNLENGMRQLEKILINHEAVIAYMIDPVAAAAGQMQRSDASAETASLPPSVMRAVHNLVVASTEKATEPLVEKIQALEKKLEEATKHHSTNET